MMSMVSIAKSFFVCMPFVAISLISLAGTTETHHPHNIAGAQLTLGPANRVSFQIVEKGFRSGVREPLQIAIPGQTEWIDLWQQHAAIKTNPPPAPAIDFNNKIAVEVFRGEKPTGGYGIEAVRAERNGGTLLISFGEKTPRPGGIVTQAITQPFHIVRVAINGTGVLVSGGCHDQADHFYDAGSSRFSSLRHSVRISPRGPVRPSTSGVCSRRDHS
jgi:hypothetical protein